MANSGFGRILLGGVGISGLLAGLAAPAGAQQSSPGGVNCPIVDGVATCSGNLSGGVTYFAGQPAVDEIRIENVSSEIAPPGYFAVGYTRTDRDLRLTVADGVTIRTVDNPNIAGPAQPIIMIGGNGRNVTLNSGATLIADGNGRPVLGTELTTSGGAAGITLTNRGNVTATTTSQDAVALSAILQNATGTVSVTNSGTLTAVSGGSGERDDATAGIRILSGLGREVRVDNSGAIAITTGPDTFDTDFQGAAAGIITNALAPVSSTTIVNTGTITGTGPNAEGIIGFARGSDRANASTVAIDNRGAITIDGFDNNGILNQIRGLNGVATTSNQAAITLRNAQNSTGLISVIETAIGEATITNSGAITATGTGYARAIGISGGNPDETATYEFLIDNGGDIQLQSSFAQAITIAATRGDEVTARIVNRGDIDLSTTTDARSQGIRATLGNGPVTFPAGRSSVEIVNSGDIRMGAGSAIVVAATESRITNSGALTTTASGAHAVLVNADPAPQPGGTAGFAGTTLAFQTSGGITASGSGADAIVVNNVDQVAIDVGARVRSESGTGIRIEGNRIARIAIAAGGSVESGSGAAIVSPGQTELVLGGNGVIVGDVQLGAMADRFEAVGGGRIDGDIDMGAGNDLVRVANLDINGVLNLGDGDDRIEISGLFGFNGIDGGAGNDTAQYTTAAGQALALDLGGVTLGGIESFIQAGAGQIRFTGANDFATDYTLRGGTLVLDAAVPNVDMVTEAGTTLSFGGSLRTLGVNGALLVDGGRKASAGSVTLAAVQGSTATATITGAGSELAVAGDFLVGAGGTASLTLSAGGRVAADRLLLGDQRAEGATGRGLIAIGAGPGANGAIAAASAPGRLDVARLQFAPVDRAGATLLFNHTADLAANYSFGAAMTGHGTIRHIAGVTRLTGDSAGFLGTTEVSGGSLLVSGTLGGSISVARGGLLGGTGTVGTLDVAGTLAPGFSPGTLTVNGNVTFAAGSTFALELLANGGNDRLNATGTATINGGTVSIGLLDPETSYVGGTSYRFLNAAGGLTGTFDGLVESSAFLDFTLGYDPTGATVTIAQVRTFPDVAITPNQIAAAGGLAFFDQSSGSDALAVYNEILQLDEAPARAAFDLASGEIYAGLVASALRQGTELSEGLMLRATAETGEGLGIWGGATGRDGRIDADGNGARLSHDGYGGLIGVDYRGPDNGWAAGIAAGYASSTVSLPDRASRAEGDGWHVGGYLRYGTGGDGFTAAATLSHAKDSFDVVRSVSIGAVSRSARSDVDTSVTTVSAELRYGVAVGTGWSIGPVARFSTSDAKLDGFRETGADSLDLAGRRTSDTRTRYGGGLFTRWQGSSGTIDLSVAYLHAGKDASPARLALTGAPDRRYVVHAARGDGGAAAVALSGDLALGGGWSLGMDARGAFGANERVVSGRAVIGFRF